MMQKITNFSTLLYVVYVSLRFYTFAKLAFKHTLITDTSDKNECDNIYPSGCLCTSGIFTVNTLSRTTMREKF